MKRELKNYKTAETITFMCRFNEVLHKLNELIESLHKYEGGLQIQIDKLLLDPYSGTLERRILATQEINDVKFDTIVELYRIIKRLQKKGGAQ